MKKKLIALTICGLLLAGFSPALAAYKVGDTVSNFTINDADGNPVSLYDYYGRIIFLAFWTFG